MNKKDNQPQYHSLPRTGGQPILRPCESHKLPSLVLAKPRQHFPEEGDVCRGRIEAAAVLRVALRVNGGKKAKR
jgi:hypothetical protein